MKTLSQLKRDLSIGASVTLLESPTMPDHKYLGIKRYVIKTQSGGVTLAPSPTDTKGSFLDFPKATLLDYEGDTFKVYNVGMRDLTTDEQRILDNAPRDKEQEERDIMTDTSVMYRRTVAYFHEYNADYLRGNDWQRGRRYDHNTGKVWDESIKGSLDRVYLINAK